MKRVEVYHVDAFTTIPGKGNPAGVILNGDMYTVKEMQEITYQIGFNECVFVCSSEVADIRLRYFTPGYETPLCGHATMGAIYMLTKTCKEDKTYRIETGAGNLEVSYFVETKEIRMQQAKPKWVSFVGDKEKLCRSIGITIKQLDTRFPIMYGSTGSWTLLVPVIDEHTLGIMKPQTQDFPSILEEVPRASIHPFTYQFGDTYDFSARHFSSPFSKTIEDSVTGTASGVMGAYALDYIFTKEKYISLMIEQGKQMHKEGFVKVYANRNNEQGHSIAISGNAVLNTKIEIMI